MVSFYSSTLLSPTWLSLASFGLYLLPLSRPWIELSCYCNNLQWLWHLFNLFTQTFGFLRESNFYWHCQSELFCSVKWTTVLIRSKLLLYLYMSIIEDRAAERDKMRKSLDRLPSSISECLWSCDMIQKHKIRYVSWNTYWIEMTMCLCILCHLRRNFSNCHLSCTAWLPSNWTEDRRQTVDEYCKER